MMSEPTIVGIDLGKNWFRVIGVDARGATVLRRKMNRMQLAEYAATAPRCIVAMESCPGSQYWGRGFTKTGHEVRLLPAQFVKPYLKANKNDFNDAGAIAEAGGRASMRCVPLKTHEQLELQALHRFRRRFLIERTAVVNQMRALLLEHGIVIPLGRALFARRLPAIFEDAENGLSPRLVILLHRLRQRWLAIDVEIEQATRDLTQWAEQSELCRRAATVPGIGPMICHRRHGGGWRRPHVCARTGYGRVARAGPATVLDGRQTVTGRDQQTREHVFAQLFIQGANALYLHMKRDRSSLGDWLRQVEGRRHRNVAVVALANKMVRICWKVLTSEQVYHPYPARIA